MDALNAEKIGFIVYALLFCIFYSERILYLAMVAFMAFIGGHEILEYAPAVFIPVEIIVAAIRIFKRGFMRRQ